METLAEAPAPTATRTLIPHEHGAYGQLIMPLVTALAVAPNPGVAAFALTLAIVAVFVAHEALLVVVGQRGRRSLEADGPRARRLLAWLGGIAAVAGVLGAVRAPAQARLALALSAILAGAVAWLVLRRLEKTILGEILVAATLSSGGLAVALAGRAPLAWAGGCWMTWVLAFAAATLAVQVILVRARSKGREDPGPAHAAVVALLVALAFAVSWAAGIPRASPVALLPTALLSVAVCLTRFSPKRLRELGWAMVASSVVTMAILVIGLR